MCGILGSASVKINNINWIRDGLASLAHRGPDRSGIYISKDQKICFAHNRLSIIDLTKNGNQPMVDSNNNVLTFNGEI